MPGLPLDAQTRGPVDLRIIAISDSTNRFAAVFCAHKAVASRLQAPGKVMSTAQARMCGPVKCVPADAHGE